MNSLLLALSRGFYWQDGYPGPAEPEGFSCKCPRQSAIRPLAFVADWYCNFTDYIPHPSDVGRFFSDYYARLAASGISFTKCDNMASIDAIHSARTVTFSPCPSSSSNPHDLTETLGEEIDVPRIRVAYKEAVKAAATRHFGGADRGRVIWCMEMSPRVLLGREIGLKDGSGRYVCRNSDDCARCSLGFSGQSLICVCCRLSE